MNSSNVVCPLPTQVPSPSTALNEVGSQSSSKRIFLSPCTASTPAVRLSTARAATTVQTAVRIFNLRFNGLTSLFGPAQSWGRGRVTKGIVKLGKHIPSEIKIVNQINAEDVG